MSVSIVYLYNVLLLSCCLNCCSQIPVDILEGVTGEQARKMAENLEFKGPALDEVKSLD